MLVLSRHKDESIVIDDDITILVVDIKGDKVRLGIDAPREVPVHRREVYDAIYRGKSTHEKSISAKGLEKVVDESRTSSEELHQQYINYRQSGDLQNAYSTFLVNPPMLSRDEACELAIELGKEKYGGKK